MSDSCPIPNCDIPSGEEHENVQQMPVQLEPVSPKPKVRLPQFALEVFIELGHMARRGDIDPLIYEVEEGTLKARLIDEEDELERLRQEGEPVVAPIFPKDMVSIEHDSETLLDLGDWL